MAEEKIIELLEKIDVKLGLLLGNQLQEEDNIKKKVEKLSKAKLGYTEIAQILGISPTHAAKELSKIRKEKK